MVEKKKKKKKREQRANVEYKVLTGVDDRLRRHELEELVDEARVARVQLPATDLHVEHLQQRAVPPVDRIVIGYIARASVVSQADARR